MASPHGTVRDTPFAKWHRSLGLIKDEAAAAPNCSRLTVDRIEAGHNYMGKSSQPPPLTAMLMADVSRLGVGAANPGT